MKIYLINRTANAVISEHDNVYEHTETYICFGTKPYVGKSYCDPETEYFTDTPPEVTAEADIPAEVANEEA